MEGAWSVVTLLAAAVAPPTPPLADWQVDAESPAARVTEQRGVIDIDTPKGLTLWSKIALDGPVTIRFEAMAVSAGGANDTVSDLNAFWMATNSDGSSVLTTPRSGAFDGYDSLKTYYVGIGGNRNTTTRLRRYVGERGNRPILPEHDKTGSADLLAANRWTRITLVADGRAIRVERDGKRLFVLDDAQPYTHGHWGLRTTWSHLRIRHVQVSAR